MGTLAVVLALLAASPSPGADTRASDDAVHRPAPTPSADDDPHDTRAGMGDRTRRELALLHQHALRDPFAGPATTERRVGSPDLRDPFEPATRVQLEPVPSPDLRDPFVEPAAARATPAPPAPACSLEVRGVPLQRPRALAPQRSTCEPAPRRPAPPPPAPPARPRAPGSASAATHIGIGSLST